LIFYAANAFSVLRLNTDAVTILSSALSDFRGQGRLFHGQPTVFPPGYPSLVTLLLDLDIASTSALVAINLVLLCGGVASYYFLARRTFTQLSAASVAAICALTMISWVMVKHAPLPLTDVPYFALSMMSLLALEVSRRRIIDGGKIVAVVSLSLGLIFAAIAVRRIGIALLPPLVLLLGIALWQGTRLRLDGQKLLGPVLIGLGIVLLALWWRSTSTAVDLPATGSLKSFLAQVSLSLQYRLAELVEVMLNLPASKLSFLGGPPGIALGVAATLLIVLGMLGRGIGACELYLLGYGAIIAIWPYGDPRFLLPVIPLLLTYAYLGFCRVLGGHQLQPVILLVWLSLYAVGGGLSLIYSARISLAAHDFPLVYGDGTLRETYCAHLRSCGAFDAAKVHEDALEILRSFDRSGSQ
jgi:hypothetical protein